MFRHVFSLLACLATTSMAYAEDNSSAQWNRYAAVSPDGKSVVFSSQGDLYKVALDGGPAQRLTSHEGIEINPVWSHDGTRLAFAGFRHGNFDVYVMPAGGGPSTRLTDHSRDDLPYAFSLDDRSVLYGANLNEPVSSSRFPNRMRQLYQVSTQGGRTQLVTAEPMMNLDVGEAGILFEDYKGYEDEWRKHHQSPVTRDIWLFDRKANSFRQLTDFPGEDRNPRWAADGKGFYYLSEASGSFNIWYQDLAQKAPKQITFHKDFPVRYLSIASTGVLVYSLHGKLYHVLPGSEPVRIPMGLSPLEHAQEAVDRPLENNITEFDVSPKHREIAFIVRGDIYVASTEFGTTKRITHTPEQERHVSFNSDGNVLIYEAERNGRWDIYQTSIQRKDEKYFADATVLEEKILNDGPGEKMNPQFSPDGRFIAFLQDRSKIRIQDLATKKQWTLVEQNLESYQDGDIWFRWSPDSAWLVLEYLPSHMDSNSRVGIIDVLGKQGIRDVTKEGYGSWEPEFTKDGQAVLWVSTRHASRSHLLSDSNAQSDIYATFMNYNALDNFEMSAEDFERQKANAGEEKSKKKDKTSKKPKPIAMDWDGMDKRLKRLTPFSSNLNSAYLQKDFEKLYFLSQVDKAADLWQIDLKKGDSKKLTTVKGASSSFEMDFDEKNLIILAEGNLFRLALKDNQLSPIVIKGTWESSAQEYVYMFEHIWRQIQKKFYNPDFHQVDWKAVKASYQQKLPFITNEYDFAELTSEMAGELNASHMGTKWRIKGPVIDETAALGLIFDHRFAGPELKVDEIIEGGPMAKWKSKLKPGFLITSIDGQKLSPAVDPFSLLEGKVGQKIRLDIKDGNQTQSLILKAINQAAQDDLLYYRWVQNRRQLVEKLSGGRIGYVHIRGMNDDSYRMMISDLYGQHPKAEALVVDTRFNGGGWLHDELSAFLSAQPSYFVKPQGRLLTESPRRRWSKPSVVVMSAGNYSDAHAFPYIYKTLKLGPLVGVGVAGTSTSVWWEPLQTGNLVFGIPQWGITSLDGSYLENQTLEPDYRVTISPEDFQAGRDPQIERATTLMLETLNSPGRIVNR